MTLVWRVERDQSGHGHYAVYENGVLVDRLDSLDSVNRNYPCAVEAQHIFSVEPRRRGVTTFEPPSGKVPA
jgi:hypothetical protein